MQKHCGGDCCCCCADDEGCGGGDDGGVGDDDGGDDGGGCGESIFKSIGTEDGGSLASVSPDVFEKLRNCEKQCGDQSPEAKALRTRQQ